MCVRTDVRDAADLRREHVEAFLIDVACRSRAATVSVRYRAVQQLFGWLVDEGRAGTLTDGAYAPARGAPGTRGDPRPGGHAPAGDLRGARVRDRRDAAIFRLFFDTGMRRAELASLTPADIDVDLDVAVVMGKGRRPRSCPFGHHGAALVKPRGIPYAVWNAGTDPARVLEILLPGGLEDYFEELAPVLANHAPPADYYHLGDR